jgi:23S rRNA (guanosine2251-2'-O)-methyltransferase
MDKTSMIFGTRAVMEAIRSGREIEKIFVQSGLNNDLIKEMVTLAKERGVPYTFTPQQKLNSLSSKNHQGVICMLATIQYQTVDDLIHSAFSDGRDPFFLVLDRITDVRNFGAIARTVECAGLDGIIIADKGNAPISADAIKTSSGALNHLPVARSADLRKTFEQLRESGVKIIACTEKASQSIYKTDLTGPVAIVVGSEEDGITPELLRLADAQVKIPMKGQVGSLNVSVSAGVAIYEGIRQKAEVAKFPAD